MTRTNKLQEQVQLDNLLSLYARAPFELRLPCERKEYVFGKSSRGKKIHIPTWISLGGLKYVKLDRFPNTQNEVSEHAGAHGCVAAYEIAPCSRELLSDIEGLPARVALKCVPFGPKKKVHSSPWASEWRIHDYLRTCSATSGQSPAHVIQNGAFVSCLGGVSCTIARSCQVFFAMELMDTDLFTMIERSASVPNFGDWILRALYSTCKALDTIHRSGMIYCDLKPENVLVRIADSHAKFGDFDRSCIPSLNVGVVGGTKGYYSPERMRNSSIHTHADDVWAFGVLILIGATTAASPYLDYTVENIHKFVPSRYLQRYHRCGWSPHVVNRVGQLCDMILHVDKDVRATLDVALDTLQTLVHELDSFEQVPQTLVMHGFPMLSPVNHQPHRVLQMIRREMPATFGNDQDDDEDDEDESKSYDSGEEFIPINAAAPHPQIMYPATPHMLQPQPYSSQWMHHPQSLQHQPQLSMSSVHDTIATYTTPIQAAVNGLMNSCTAMPSYAGGLEEPEIQPVPSAVTYIPSASSGVPVTMSLTPSSSSCSLPSKMYRKGWNGSGLTLSCSTSSCLSYSSSGAATAVLSPKLGAVSQPVGQSIYYTPQAVTTPRSSFLASPMSCNTPRSMAFGSYVAAPTLETTASPPLFVGGAVKRQRSTSPYDDLFLYEQPKRQLV